MDPFLQFCRALNLKIMCKNIIRRFILQIKNCHTGKDKVYGYCFIIRPYQTYLKKFFHLSD